MTTLLYALTIGTALTLLHLGIRRLVKLIRGRLFMRDLKRFGEDVERRMGREIYERQSR
jgi:hypothetical protein